MRFGSWRYRQQSAPSISIARRNRPAITGNCSLKRFRSFSSFPPIPLTPYCFTNEPEPRRHSKFPVEEKNKNAVLAQGPRVTATSLPSPERGTPSVISRPSRAEFPHNSHLSVLPRAISCSISRNSIPRSSPFSFPIEETIGAVIAR